MKEQRSHYRTCLLTGASSGLGRGLAAALAAQGTEVVLCARRERELEELAAEIRSRGGSARALVLDVADTEATVRAIREVDEAIGGLDLVIANAGVGTPSRKEAFTWEAIRGSCHVNFCGAAATLTAVLPRMVERGRGHLVGVSSLASFGPLPGSAAYCAPKAGLSMLLECLRMDLLGTGVAATAVHPGFITTPMTERSKHPMPQLMSVEAAVGRILKELPGRPATIDFPEPLASITRWAGHLPRPVRDFVLRRETFSKR